MDKNNLKKNHNKKEKKGKQNTMDYYCNPQCNGYGWTMVFIHPLIFITV
jgi:hypothetical protein